MGLTSRGDELKDEQGLQQIASKLCLTKNALDYRSQDMTGSNHCSVAGLLLSEDTIGDKHELILGQCLLERSLV
ncbi:hypothetical protein PBY51_021349 [Eleginops maclovinus]|uniref:Uncharacterized protein n=1 Tax=Eleginops maclovinus TaxID=56733 RepID=A0AAN7XHR1_ELEMC|nr:hypothetical protein PBY51_021349 [Eleginops maclovinus]